MPRRFVSNLSGSLHHGRWVTARFVSGRLNIGPSVYTEYVPYAGTAGNHAWALLALLLKPRRPHKVFGANRGRLFVWWLALGRGAPAVPLPCHLLRAGPEIFFRVPARAHLMEVNLRSRYWPDAGLTSLSAMRASQAGNAPGHNRSRLNLPSHVSGRKLVATGEFSSTPRGAGQPFACAPELFHADCVGRDKRRWALWAYTAPETKEEHLSCWQLAGDRSCLFWGQSSGWHKAGRQDFQNEFLDRA